MKPEKFVGKQIREYRILEVIGQGGMAAVLKAEHINLKAIRAIKVIRETLSKNPEFEKRFFREARLLVQLTHPNLVQVHDFFEEDDHLFLVMSYVPGESLADRIARMEIMHPVDILPIMIQALEGLADAHQLGILHRDISPDNIMLTPGRNGTDKVVIIDFGLAKPFSQQKFSETLATNLTVENKFLGKLFYCSPEQAGADPMDGRSDIYSIGLVLHRCLTGTVPFNENTPIKILAGRLNTDPPALAEAYPGGDFSDHLEAVMTMLLAREPEFRYQSAEEAGDDLSKVLEMVQRDGSPGKTPRLNVVSTGTETSPKGIDTQQSTVAELFNQKPRWMAVPAVLILAAILVLFFFFRPDHVRVPVMLDTGPGMEKLILENEVAGFRYVPPGSFRIGQLGEKGDAEKYSVSFSSGFFLAETEITQAQWQALMPGNPSEYQTLDRPVETVTWFDTLVYCNKRSESEGLTPCYYRDAGFTRIFLGTPPVHEGAVFWNSEADGYRLPTEAEWEYACRAGTDTPIYTGQMSILGKSNCPELDPIAWYAGNSGVTDINGFFTLFWRETQYSHKEAATHPVRQKAPNQWGFYDMIGNVWEWCWDWKAPYPQTVQTDPRGPVSGHGRIIRGGAWNSRARLCRGVERNSYWPRINQSSVGFRVVKQSPVAEISQETPKSGS